MTTSSPILTFEVSVPSRARPEAVYSILADPSTHLEWAGRQAPKEDFKLLTLDAQKGRATVGTTFASSGASSKNGTMTFYDDSTVTEATAPSRFAFDTDSTLERKHRKTWRARFVHSYTLRTDGEGSRIDYTCAVFPQNYRPYWLHPLMRPMTKKMVNSIMTKHLENLARMAEDVPALAD